MTNGVLAQLDDLERRLDHIHSELRDLRAAVLEPAAPEPSPTAPRARTASQRAWTPPPSKPATATTPKKEPSFWERRVTLPKIEPADLLGARALAWAGGVVTLLGVVFFFVLAVNRGWVGPAERVLLGALASSLVFAGGLVMRHRYGQLYSAVSAVGAGIAGGYATLLAAAAMYGLVPDLAALAIAAGIAGVGTAVALAWNSQTVASLGLVGAALVPLAHAVDTEIGTLGTTSARMPPEATSPWRRSSGCWSSEPAWPAARCAGARASRCRQRWCSDPRSWPGSQPACSSRARSPGSTARVWR